MTLSILIPAYNSDRWLQKILDSLVEQIGKYPDTEIIVVDDGSTKDLSYVKDYPYVRYIRQENGGEGSSRNRLLDEAQGKYIQYIDHDDEIYSNALDVIYDNIAQGYDYVSYEFDTDHDRKRSYHNYGQLLINCPCWGYTLRKSITTGYRFDETMMTGCDVKWLILVLKKEYKHKHDDRVWYNYRWDGNDNSLCHRRLRGEIT